ncbi:MAG: hypothetical protein AABY15_08595 [Nanoarchaeota archaeon]
MIQTTKQKPIDFVANDIALIYGAEGYYQFKKMCIDGSFNPLIVLTDFYPAYWYILSSDFRKELFEEVERKWETQEKGGVK